MSSIDTIKKFAIESWPTESSSIESVEKLTKIGASSRDYYRVRFGARKSLIVMESQRADAAARFVEMSARLKSLRAPVPKIYHSERRRVALEDLSETTLAKRIATESKTKIIGRYCSIIDRLIEFQLKARSAIGSEQAWVGWHSFSIECLTKETSFTTRRFLQETLNVNPSNGMTNAIRNEWRDINSILAERMETICHRDLHADNIMILTRAKSERAIWIDYQDALLGRLVYDLASLLEDPYVDLADEMREELARYYHQRMSSSGKALLHVDHFSKLYRLCALQRLYKALGTYGYQVTTAKNERFARYIEPAYRRFRRLARIESRFENLIELIDKTGAI